MTTHRPTPHEAETAGMMAAMTTGASRKVPGKYADGGRLQAAYTYGFNATIAATQSYEIDTTPWEVSEDEIDPPPTKAPRKRRKKTDTDEVKPVTTQARKAPPQPVKQVPPSMMAILDSQHVDAA